MRFLNPRCELSRGSCDVRSSTRISAKDQSGNEFYWGVDANSADKSDVRPYLNILNLCLTFITCTAIQVKLRASASDIYNHWKFPIVSDDSGGQDALMTFADS